jgi:DNA polymerase
MLIGIDFETRSDVDLIKHGRKNYLAGREADIICMAYKIDDQPTELWKPGDLLPDFVTDYSIHKFYAHNAQFDIAVWNTLGPKYYFPRIHHSFWIDVMAICGRFTFHQSLADAGNDLDLKLKKNPRGKALIKKICTPPFTYTHEDLMEFYQYCKDDVNSMHELLYALPASKLSDKEQKIWELTVKINDNGVPVDIQAAKAIYKLTEIYKEDMNELLPSLTDNKVTKATQNKRIVDWLRNQGMVVPNLQAATVEKLLKRVDLTENQRTVLQLRQELGRSSTAKYLKLIEMCHDKRIYDNLRYYAASTGRWGGLGFQLHNLPRSKVVDAQPIIDQFLSCEIIEKDPINAAKSIIRGMIRAPKGKLLLFIDYTGIENRGLAWTVDDLPTLKLFREGLDQYKDMAAYLLKKPYDEITDQERYMGKQLVLGCGYGLGWRGFVKYMEGYGTPVSDAVAQEGVNAWRARYNLVVSFWYQCRSAAINAITHPGVAFDVPKCQFKLVKDRNKTPWLQLTIPSGRNLYYNKPEIREGDYGPEVTAMGINPYSKKWQRLKIIPGRFVENIIQALSRDIIAEGKLNLDKAGFKIIASVHDEVILEVDEHCDETTLDSVNIHLCTMPSWATGLPLATEGVIEERYRKM